MVQTVPVKKLNSHSSKETSQLSKYQVTNKYTNIKKSFSETIIYEDMPVYLKQSQSLH